MSIYRVDFEAMDWQDGRPGVRQKVYREGSRLIRLVELNTSDGDPGWCDQGHIGMVLAGRLEITFDGSTLAFSAGDGLFIPAGAASRHRGTNIEPGTRLLMVEDAHD